MEESFIPLLHCTTLALFPKPPFNFDATLHKPSHFPSGDNFWEPGARWQTMRWHGRRLGLKFAAAGTQARPELAISVWSAEPLEPAFVEGVGAELRYRLSLDLDLNEFNRRFSHDPQLGPLIDKWCGMRPLNVSSLYEYLIIAVMLQNATVRRSVNMFQALFDAYGRQLFYDDRMLASFWLPEEIGPVPEEDLRALKVGYRAKSIKRLSAAFAAGEVDEFALRSRPVTEQRQALLRLYGVGPASVWYLLFDVFHHLDELNYISPWEQKIYSKLFFDADPADPVPVEKLLDLFATRFGEYRMLAVHYIWEDLFWRRKHAPVDWLESLIRL